MNPNFRLFPFVGRPLAVTICKMLVVIRMGDLSKKSEAYGAVTGIASLSGSIRMEKRLQPAIKFKF
jgi:hypothetical protein